MNSKYQGLPDIDTAPDIFETADEPEPPLRPNDNGIAEDDAPPKPTSEAIDSSGLPARRKAERVFGRGTRRPDPSDTRFRPRLPPLARHRSTSSSDEESTVLKETPAARMRRLKAELAEVEKEMSAGPSTQPSTLTPPVDSLERAGKRKSVLPPKEPVDLFAELAVLREKMNAVEVGDTGGVGAPQVGWKERLERLERLERPVSVQNGGVIEGDGDAGPSPGGGSEGGARLSDLDKRLASLEDLVGPSTEGLDSTSNSAPLLSTLSKLDHLLALLTQPRHLDAISRRVKLLLVDLDRAAAASRRPGGTSTVTTAPSDKATSNITLSSAEYASLQTLFSLLPRLDPLLPILPPLLARLRSLAGLHAEASDVADGLRRLQMEDKKNGEEIRELEEVVKTVQEGLGESAKGIMKNWEGIEGRMKRLEERVGKLGEGA